MPARSPALRLAPAALLLAACAPGETPGRIALHALATLDPPTAPSAFAGPLGRAAELVHAGSQAVLAVHLEPEDWEAEHGLLHAPVPPGARLVGLRLETEEGPVEWADAPRPRERGRSFTLRDGRIVLSGFGAGPPARATLYHVVRTPEELQRRRLHMERLVSAVHGQSVARLERVSADGLQVLPGEGARVRLAIPPASRLHFGTVREPLLDEPADVEATTFRVALDGEVLFEGAMRGGAGPRCAWHSVDLPAAGVAEGELVFSVTGALANTAFACPRIEPDPHEREDERPDLILFLADTFRADGLAAYGGRHGAAPRLDALAERSVVFRRAWSTSTWTLPAHASLFSGYYPPQVLGDAPSPRLPAELETLAERLAAAGYRTGAITAGGYVSSLYGLDQGFEFFLERHSAESLASLLADARAFLEAGDGRPTFLFVHTYRTHWPYVASDEARRALAGRVEIRGQAEELLAAIRGPDEAIDPHRSAIPRSEAITARVAELHAHYLGGVADLDREVGLFLDALEARAFFERGYLVFTSDHGEAFGEHDMLFHLWTPFEELARIPLFLRGPTLEPGVVEEAVSLVDLPPTLLALAGLEPEADWPGRSLLARGPERFLYGFGFPIGVEVRDTVFALADGRKVFLEGSEELTGPLRAFDLEEDPREQRDLVETEEEWPERMAQRCRPELVELFRLLIEGEAAEVDVQRRAELEALGY